MPEYIWGRNPILEALQAKRKIGRIFFAEGLQQKASILEIREQAIAAKIPVELAPRGRLDTLSQGANHQGCLAIVEAFRYAQVEDMLALARAKEQAPFLLILDSIQDVHNLGSLMRSAEAVGIHGVILPRHRAAEVNATVVKTSAGATEHLLIAQETNLTRTIDILKEQHIWVIGLAGEAQTLYNKADLSGPMALVVGNEEKGLSRLVREHCDLLVTLPMLGSIDSLNAAIAGSIALYEALRQRTLS